MTDNRGSQNADQNLTDEDRKKGGQTSTTGDLSRSDHISETDEVGGSM